MGFFLASVLCLVIPFEITHLLSAIVGIAVYLVLQPLSIQRAPSPVGKINKVPHSNNTHVPRPWTPARPQHIPVPSIFLCCATCCSHATPPTWGQTPVHMWCGLR